jgi:GR25 family glycosyltransferase involved in LPS biosynthesis
MQLPYSGRYINLDRSADRRARLEKQLRELGIERAYSRFAAVDGSAVVDRTGTISSREYGCFASHAQVIKDACSGGTHLHVLEDDALLSPEFVPVVAGVIGQGFLDQYDILFTDVYVPPDPVRFAQYERARRENTSVDPATGREYLKSIVVFDLRNTAWACTSSYVVSRRCLGRMAELLENALSAGPAAPIDLTLRELVNSGALKAGCLVPFLTSIDLALDVDSTIHASSDQERVTRLACNVVRQTLFVRPDWQTIGSVLHRYFPAGAPSARREAVGRIMDFVVFGDAKLS